MPEWLHFFVPSGDIGEGWILAVAMMTNVACGVIGCYLVLRRMSLMGDAISHAVLPGLVIAFLFTGSLNIGGMFVGALRRRPAHDVSYAGPAPSRRRAGRRQHGRGVHVAVCHRASSCCGAMPAMWTSIADCVLQGQLTLMPNIRRAMCSA